MPNPAVEIALFPCLQDNFGLLLQDKATGKVAAIDTPDADRIAQELEARGWTLDTILNTHWHADHTGGNLALKARYDATVIGPEAEANRISGLDRGVGEGAVVMLGETQLEVFATPGHTNGHIVYHDRADGVLFVGDTLFAMGCGRLFEGTADQMWRNMQRLADLPEATRVYCAHEYTLSNARFAMTVEPENPALAARLAAVTAARERGEATVPFAIAEERATNPFMRAGSVEEFARRRAAKDGFK